MSRSFEQYASKAGSGRMRAIARLARARELSQRKAAVALGVHDSTVRKHFESKAVRVSTVEKYVALLARNEAERNIIREYLDVLDGDFDKHLARERLRQDLCDRELSLSDGSLPGLLAAIDAIDDETLQPALQAYLRTDLEGFLGFERSPNLLSSSVAFRLDLAFAAFADAIRERVNIEAFLAAPGPAETALNVLWGDLAAWFSEDEREAIIATAVGLLVLRGFDSRPILQFVDRLRKADVRAEALRATESMNPTVPPTERTELVIRSRSPEEREAALRQPVVSTLAILQQDDLNSSRSAPPKSLPQPVKGRKSVKRSRNEP